jgi:hypothetical protein
MRKMHLRCICVLILLTANLLFLQAQTFDGVKVRVNRSNKYHCFTGKNVDLVFDDKLKHFIVKYSEKPIVVSYDSVQKIVFEADQHMGEGNLGFLLGGVVGAAIFDGSMANNYWCNVEYRNHDIEYCTLEIEKKSSEKIINKMKSIFSDKVIMVDFPEKAVEIDKETLKDLQSKHSMKVDEQNHPMPQLKTDQALVVVVCPLFGSYTPGEVFQLKMHANDEVVWVNNVGTYGYFYLNPGEYLLVSQSGNASGIRLKLEAGKDYYFFQNLIKHRKIGTILSRNTKELVMHELSSAYYSNWKRKK